MLLATELWDGGKHAMVVGFARLTMILIRSVDRAPGLKGAGARRLHHVPDVRALDA